MTHKAIITDLNRCVGCLACSVACKALNGVQIGNYWNKVMRVGPNLEPDGSGKWPDAYMYFLPMTCQHCSNPECVKVCPTEASHIAEDGTIQIDKEKCIGCQFCVMACPYGVRYLNEEELVVEKCTLCEQRLTQDEIPACVAQCGGNARWVGDIDEGYDSFIGARNSTKRGKGDGEYRKMMDFLEPFEESDVHSLPDVGNGPANKYILRRHHWEEGDK